MNSKQSMTIKQMEKETSRAIAHVLNLVKQHDKNKKKNKKSLFYRGF